MNNIGGANVVILKRPTVEEADSDCESHTYPVTAATRSQKKNLEAKKYQHTSRVTKPAGRNSERPIANQVLRNQDRLNNRTMRSPSLSPPPSEDEEMEDSVTVRGNSYRLRGALYPGQDQEEKRDGGAHDQPPSLPRPQQADKVQDDRFQTEPCVENPVPLPRWQRLDRSPQSKVQPARAIASSWDFKREEKSAGPKIVGTAAVATKFSTPLAIESVAHEHKRGMTGCY